MTNQARDTAHFRQDRHGQRLSFLLAVVLLSTVQLQAWASTAEDDEVTARSEQPSLSPAPDPILAWKATVAWLKESMNESVDPCEDFYQYSCGNCHDVRRAQDGDKLQNTMTLRLKGLLENSDNPTTPDPRYIQTTKDLYRSCMNEAKLEELGAGPLQELVKKLELWPLTFEGSSERAQDLETTLVNLAYAGVCPFFQVRVAQDVHNNSLPVISLYSGVLSLTQQYLLMPRNSTAMVTQQRLYLSLAEKVLDLQPSDGLKKSISEVVDFEVELAKIFPNSTDDSSSSESSEEDAEDGKMVLADLDNLVPNFNVKRYLTTYFRRAYVSLSPNTSTKPDYVYVRNLTDLLGRTDNRVVLNYLLMHLVRSHYPYLHQEIRDLAKPMKQVLYGEKGLKTQLRWKTCVAKTTDIMRDAVGVLYIKKYFSPTEKEKATKFVNFIRESMKEVIEAAEWLDDATRTKALEKVEAIVENVGYPEYLLNETVMENGYRDVNFNPEAYFENILQVYHADVVVSAGGLTRPKPPRDTWKVPLTEINAFYDSQTNVMTFPAANFQPPNYGDNVTYSQMFGRLGVMVGHEITHAFDNEGRKFDKDGNKVGWWSNEAIANFNNLSYCFVDQYGEHVISGLKLDGSKTLSENIADNGGIKIAFKAFKKWQEMTGTQPIVPDSNMTHAKIFFTSMAQMWCRAKTHEEAKTSVMTSVHSPEHVRATKMVSNSEEFAKAFNCPVGSEMNPKKKCVLW